MNSSLNSKQLTTNVLLAREVFLLDDPLIFLAINLPSSNGIAANCEVNGWLLSTSNALFADQHFRI